MAGMLHALFRGGIVEHVAVLFVVLSDLPHLFIVAGIAVVWIGHCGGHHRLGRMTRW
ncbi:hypothetical protein D3C80_1278140 [compost metagenome]